MTILHDLRVAGRSLLVRPALSLGVVLTLALGIGATATIFSVVDGVVLRPLPYQDAARLVALGSIPPTSPGIDSETGLQDLVGMTSLDYEGFRERARSFDRISAIARQRILISDENGLDDFIPAASVDEDFFGMLGVPPAVGRTFVPEEFEFPEELGSMFGNVALITHGYWQRRYGGDPDILGQPLETGATGAARATIVGVLPESYRPPGPFFGPEELPEVYVPMRLPPSSGSVRMILGDLRGLGLLRPSASLDGARAEAARIATEIESPFDAGPGGLGTPGSERRSLGANGLYEETVGTTAATLWVFLGAAGLLLLLAAMNASSILLARALDRRQELGVRAALGAGRGRLVTLLLQEAGILTVSGALLGVVAAYVGVDAFHRFAPPSLPRLSAVVVDARVLSVAAVLSVLTGLAAGLLPALRLTRRSAWDRMRAGGRSVSEPGLGLRSLLVGGQLAVAVVLLAGAGLLFNSFMRLRSADPGFDPDGLLIMSATPTEGIRIRFGEIADVWTRWDPVLAGLGAIQGVTSVAGASELPFETPAWAPRLLLEGDDPEAVREGIAGYVVTPGYFEAVGTEVLSGRGFVEQDRPEAERVVVVNESFVRTQMGGGDPLNAIVRRVTEGIGATGEIVPMRVVGVARDAVQSRVEDGPRPAVYIPYSQADVAQLTDWSQVLRTSLPAASIVPEVRRTLSALGQVTREVEPMEERMSTTRTTPRFQAMLVGAFGAVALLLAALGLYGALAETVRRLRREIGIRIALGAERSALVLMVAGQGLRLAVAGLAIGLSGALALSRVLARFLYDVEPYDPLTMALVAVVLLLVAAVACIVPARHAVSLDPVTVLNSE